MNQSNHFHIRMTRWIACCGRLVIVGTLAVLLIPAARGSTSSARLAAAMAGGHAAGGLVEPASVPAATGGLADAASAPRAGAAPGAVDDVR